MTQHDSLTTHEFSRLIESAHNYSLRDAVTAYLIGSTGLRRAEAAHFAPEWFDDDGPVVTVPAKYEDWSPSYAHHARHIPLSSSVAENLRRYLDEMNSDVFGVAGSTVYDRVKRAAAVAGMNDVTPRTLRNTYARRLLYYGVPTHVVASVLGVRRRLVINEYIAHDRRFARSGIQNHWETDDEPDLW